MDNHPIPQDVTGFQFKLVGNMTVKQFAYLATGVVLAAIIYKMPINFLIRLPFSAFFALLGAGLAYLPISGRPMDLMIGNYIKALFRPTQFIYEKVGGQLYFPTATSFATINTIMPHKIDFSLRPKDKLKAYLESMDTKPKNKADEKEDDFLMSVSNIATGDTSYQLPADPSQKIPQSNLQPNLMQQTYSPIMRNDQPLKPSKKPFPPQTETDLSSFSAAAKATTPKQNMMDDYRMKNAITKRTLEELDKLGGYPITNKGMPDYFPPIPEGMDPKEAEAQRKLREALLSFEDDELAASKDGDTSSSAAKKSDADLAAFLKKCDEEGNGERARNELQKIMYVNNLMLMNPESQMGTATKGNNFLMSTPNTTTGETPHQSSTAQGQNISPTNLQPNLIQQTYSPITITDQSPPIPPELAQKITLTSQPITIKPDALQDNSPTNIIAEIESNPKGRGKTFAPKPTVIIQSAVPKPPPAKPAEPEIPQQAYFSKVTTKMRPNPEGQNKNIKPIIRGFNRNIGMPNVPTSPNLIIGITKDSRGNDLSNILVEVKDKDGNPVRAFKTNEFGRFASATPLTNGTYTIEFEDPKGQNRFGKMTISANGQIILPIEAISIDMREELRMSLFPTNTPTA